jgi:hypothetical protein
MKTVLLSGYRAGLCLERNSRGELLIDIRIHHLQRLGFEVICVLAGSEADDLLRASRALMTVELVFDTNDQPNLASNLKAGLFATSGEGCYTLPLEVVPPEMRTWNFLREEWRKSGFQTTTCAFQAVDAQGAPCHFGFPLLISRSGNSLIRSLKGFSSLVDTRLKYQHLVFSEDATLAPYENSPELIR